MMTRKKLGARLRFWRELSQLTQAELAERTGLVASWISHYETGKRYPSPEHLQTIALCLGCEDAILQPFEENGHDEPADVHDTPNRWYSATVR